MCKCLIKNKNLVAFSAKQTSFLLPCPRTTNILNSFPSLNTLFFLHLHRFLTRSLLHSLFAFLLISGKSEGFSFHPLACARPCGSSWHNLSCVESFSTESQGSESCGDALCLWLIKVMILQDASFDLFVPYYTIWHQINWKSPEINNTFPDQMRWLCDYICFFLPVITNLNVMWWYQCYSCWFYYYSLNHIWLSIEKYIF